MKVASRRITRQPRIDNRPSQRFGRAVVGDVTGSGSFAVDWRDLARCREVRVKSHRARLSVKGDQRERQCRQRAQSMSCQPCGQGFLLLKIVAGNETGVPPDSHLIRFIRGQFECPEGPYFVPTLPAQSVSQAGFLGTKDFVTV